MNSIGKNTKEIYLAHISRDCNSKDLAYKSLINTFKNRNYDYTKLKIQALDKEEVLQTVKALKEYFDNKGEEYGN